MYLIEKIEFETLRDFQNKLNSMRNFEVVQILEYRKNEFDKAGEATVLLKE